MDTSAFDADDESDLSLADVYDTLPDDVQNTIKAILVLAGALAKVGLMVAAIACCAVAFGLLLVWVCLFYILTQLLLYLSAALKICFEDANDASKDDKGDGRAITVHKVIRTGRPSQNPDELLHNGSKLGERTSTSHTSAEFDLFEAFLNSPRELKERRNVAEERKVSDGLNQRSDTIQKTTVVPTSRLENEIPQTHVPGEDQHQDDRSTYKEDTCPPDPPRNTAKDDAGALLKSEPTYTLEQLEEAANFAAEATKGGSSRYRPNQQRTPALGGLLQPKRAISTTIPKAAPRTPPTSISDAQNHFAVLASTHDSEEDDAPGSKETILRRPSALPPHLRNKPSASKIREKEALVSTEVLFATKPALGLKSDKDAPFNRSDGREDLFNSQQHPEEDKELMESMNGKAGIEEDIQPIRLISMVKQTSNSHQQNSDNALKPPQKSVGERLSFNELLKMDPRQCSQTLTSIVEDGGEQITGRNRLSDVTPPITKLAKHAMSVQDLKSLNYGAGSEPGSSAGTRVPETVDPDTLKKIERLATLSRVQARDDADPPTKLKKAKKMRNRTQNIAMLESELTTEDINLARLMGEEEAIRLMQAASEKKLVSSKPHVVPDKHIPNQFQAPAKSIPSLNVTPNTQTDEGVETPIVSNLFPPVFTRMPERTSTLDDGRAVLPGSDEQGSPVQQPDAKSSPQAHDDLDQDCAISDEQIEHVEDSDSTIDNMSEHRRFASTHRGSNCSSRSPEQEAALREVAQAIDKRLAKTCESSQDRSLDQAPNSDGTARKADNGRCASTQPHHLSELLGLDFNQDAVAAPSSLQANKAKSARSLSAEAPAFHPSLDSKVSEGTVASKQSKLRASSNTFKPSRNGFSQAQVLAGTDGIPLTSSSLDFANHYASGGLAGHAHLEAKPTSLPSSDYSNHQSAPFTSEIVAGISNGGVEKTNAYHLENLKTADEGGLQTSAPGSLNLARSFEPVKGFESRFTSPTPPARSLGCQPVPSYRPFPGLAEPSIDAEVTRPAISPGSKEAVAAKQQISDKLLEDADNDVGTRSDILDSDPTNTVADTRANGSRYDQVVPKSLEADDIKDDVLRTIACQSQAEKDALRYIAHVKAQLADRPQVYNRFLDIMSTMKSNKMDHSVSLARINALFADHPDLIEKLKAFLPKSLIPATAKQKAQAVDAIAPLHASSTSGNARNPSEASHPAQPTAPVDGTLTANQGNCSGRGQRRTFVSFEPKESRSTTSEQLEPDTSDIETTNVEHAEAAEGPRTKGGDKSTHHELPQERDLISDEKGSTDSDNNKSNKSSEKKKKEKKRRKIREAFREAARKREEIRKRHASSYTLDGAKSLEHATEVYMLKRSELAQWTVSGELNEEDAAAFPILRGDDLKAQKTGKTTASSLPSKSQKTSSATKAKNNSDNKSPSQQIQQHTLDELLEEAIKARDSYESAHGYLERPPPRSGKTHLKDVRKPFEAQIRLARARYYKKIEAVEAAYPSGLPAEVARELWTLDERAEKEWRDEHMRGIRNPNDGFSGLCS